MVGTLGLHNLHLAHGITLESLFHSLIMGFGIVAGTHGCSESRLRLTQLVVVGRWINRKQHLALLHIGASVKIIRKYLTVDLGHHIDRTAGCQITGIYGGECDGVDHRERDIDSLGCLSGLL